MKILCTVLFILTILQMGTCAKILGVFVTPSISHQQTFQTVCKELALRGHDVTFVSPNILNDKSTKNLREIDVGHLYDLLKTIDVNAALSKDTSTFKRILGYWQLISAPAEQVYRDKNFQRILSSNETFDILIIQAFHPLVFAVAAEYKVPTIGISSYGVLLNMHDAIGNPTHPVISPDLLFTYDGDMTFWIKVNSFLYNFWYRALFYWYELPESDKIARKYFGNDMPYLGDLVNNVSLMMVNVNPILNPVRANVPNIIEINQVHIKKSEPLPKDLQELLDSSTKGVVYFSLGSNVKSVNLPNETRREIVAALAELPYNVLWKWETDHLPDQPKNVHVRKWLPQQDILGHPNVKVFVTQGGLQSSEEAIVKGIPIVGIPFIADQPRNVQTMIEKGLGVKVEAATLTENALKDAIIEVAQNVKYKKAVLKAKSILEDQPLKGVDKAVWWIEYVIRNGDVSHLRSPAAKMSFFEYFMIDVILFLLLAGILIMYIGIKTVRIIYNYFKPKPTKLKSS